MGSGVKFLDMLEEDLRGVAEREAERARKQPPTRRSVRWKGWLGAVAAMLVIAFTIGALAQWVGGATSASSAGGSFSTVGSAVEGGAAVPGPLTKANHARAAAPGSQGTADQGLQPSNGEAGADLTKIVRDGTIALSVPDGSFQDKLAHVVAIAHANGGFVLSSQTQASTAGTMTIRVPASRFDQAFGQVGQLGTVESSTVTGKDVTNQYLDYKAHLQNLIARRNVLRSLLARTTTVGESLAIYNDVADVQEQIDQIQGELRYLNNQVSESTLTVDLHEESVPAGETETNGSVHNPSLSHALDRAIQGFFGILATIIVGLGYLLPLAVIAGVIYGVVRLARRRGRATS
jgi:Domain of unknown function (DUF4349)